MKKIYKKENMILELHEEEGFGFLLFKDGKSKPKMSITYKDFTLLQKVVSKFEQEDEDWDIQVEWEEASNLLSFLWWFILISTILVTGYYVLKNNF